jgi:hypothetical protein
MKKSYTRKEMTQFLATTSRFDSEDIYSGFDFGESKNFIKFIRIEHSLEELQKYAKIAEQFVEKELNLTHKFGVSDYSNDLTQFECIRYIFDNFEAFEKLNLETLKKTEDKSLHFLF